MTAYPPNINSIAQYLSTQYPNNKPINQSNSKKGDKNDEDDPKSKEEDSNTRDTAGVHIGVSATTEESNAPSREANIGSKLDSNK